MTNTYPFPGLGGIEPPLAELLTDPILHLLLNRDGLGIDDVRAVVAKWRVRHSDMQQEMPAAA